MGGKFYRKGGRSWNRQGISSACELVMQSGVRRHSGGKHKRMSLAEIAEDAEKR